MILPNCEKAYVPTAKLDDYLLSTTHSVGKSKAKFFRELGFDETNTEALMSGLLSVAQTEEVFAITESQFGTKYVIDGSLPTPTGIMVRIRTVWIVETGEDEPRFVTAHPLPR